MNYIHIYRSKKSFIFYFMAVFAITAMAFIIPGIPGKSIYLLIIFFLYIVPRKGIEIDFNKKCYRLITLYFNLKFGKWKPLPDNGHLKLIQVRKQDSMMSFYTGTTLSMAKELVVINYIYDIKKNIKLYQSNDINDALKISKDLHNSLNPG